MFMLMINASCVLIIVEYAALMLANVYNVMIIIFYIRIYAMKINKIVYLSVMVLNVKNVKKDIL